MQNQPLFGYYFDTIFDSHHTAEKTAETLDMMVILASDDARTPVSLAAKSDPYTTNIDGTNHIMN